MYIWNTAFEINGIKVSKTTVMVIIDSVVARIETDGVRLERVKVFPYFSVASNERGTHDVEIKNRTIKLYFDMNGEFVGKKEVQIQIKMKIFETVFRSILNFESECWVLNARHRSKIQGV